MILYYEEWIHQPFHIEPPEGEGYPAFTDRVEKGWQAVCAHMVEESVHQFGHCYSWGRDALFAIETCPQKRDFWEWKVPHGQGFELVWSSNEAFRRGERCNLLRVVPLTENPAG